MDKIDTGSEPRLNDIGTRPSKDKICNGSSSEPRLNDIGTRHTLSILDNILNLG